MTPIELEDRADGVVLPVQAQPKSRRNGLNGIHAGRLKVQVTAPPEKGQANQAIARLLAELCGVSKSQVQLLSGATSRQKRFLVTGRTLEDVRRLIGESL